MVCAGRGRSAGIVGSRAVRSPHRGLRGAVRPAAAPDRPPGGRPLRGVALRHRRRLPGRARPHGPPRPGGRPPSSWSSPPPWSSSRPAGCCPSRPATASTTTSWPCSSSATCCWPGCWSARRSPRRASPSARMLDDGARSAPRTAGPEAWFLALAPDLLAGVTPDDLARALVRAATPKPPPRCRIDHVAPIRISVGDALDELLATLPAAGATTFRAVTEGMEPRIDVVVRFLAVLELYKQGLVELDQASHLRRAADHVDGRRRRRRAVPAGGGRQLWLVDELRRRALEAILLVAEEPVEPHLLAQLLEVSPSRVDEVCAALAAAYEDEERGFVLARVAGGYRLQTHPDLAPYVERFVLDGQPARLSGAALETLAVVAYRQPVSRPQVASVRGVNADAVMRTLAHRGYIEEVGRDPGPGQAVLYGTTRLFLEKLGHRLPRRPAAPVELRARPGDGRGDRAQALGGRARPSVRLSRWRPARGRAAAEGAGRGRLRQPAHVRGADRGGAGHGRRRGGHPRPAGRPRRGRGGGRRGARLGPSRARLLPAQQAQGGGGHRVRPPGPAHGPRPRAPRAPGVLRRPPRRRHRGPHHLHQRRRPGPPPGPPVLRRGEGVPGRGGRHPHRRPGPPAADGGRCSTTG